jgi:F-type H+-transporting ATPase subunit b
MCFETINLLLVAEETAAESSLFSPDQFAGYAVTALLTAVNVLVAYFVIKRFIFKPIVKMIHNREEALNGELDAVAKSKEEAEGVVAMSKQTIDEARKKASEILEEAQDNANKQSELIIKKANDDASDIILRAEEDVARMKRVALEEMKDDLTDLAVQIAKKVLGDAVSNSTLEASAAKYADEVIDAEVKKSE